MKTDRTKKLFLKNLKEVPIIEAACKRSGIGRTTVYSWRKKSKKFAEAMEKAVAEGEALINDLSEGQLIKLIKEGNFSALRLWLNSRHPKFREKIEVTAKVEKQDRLTPDQEKLVRQALTLSSLGKKISKPDKNNGGR